MSQQEYDNFKQKIKEWMDSHPEEYDCFEEEMNRKDNEGYQQILMMAFMIAPQFKGMIRKINNQGLYDDISNIKDLFENNNLAEFLISEFDNTSEKSIIPAMLSWLYFGKSFERMVEKGEEIRKSHELTYVEKETILSTIQMVINSSINLGFRTKSDWNEHLKIMHIVDGDNLVDWAIQNIPDEKKKVGRKPNKQTLPEMLSDTIIHKPDDILIRIEKFLISKNSKRHIACLKIALEELNYIYQCEVKTFRDALNEQYGRKIKIISERGIQDAYKELNELIHGELVKDLKENRDYIDEIKKLLSD